MKRRLFVAIDFEPKTKKQLGLLINKLSQRHPDIRWEKTEKFHLTLKFLGSTQVLPEQIIDALNIKLVDFHSFYMSFGALAEILNQVQVVVVEIVKTEELMRLYHMTNNSLEELGIKRDRRAFYPHVTLGRGKNEKKLIQLKQEKFKINEILVKQILLFESKPTPSGSIYRSLGKVELK